MKRVLCGLVALGLLVGGAGLAKGQPSYVYTTLDVPGSLDTFANGINDAGQVVGWWADRNGRDHGFLYSEGRYTTLDAPGATFASAAYGINDFGQIIGAYQNQPASSRGFLLNGTTYTDIVPPGASSSSNIAPAGINNAGQIVGYYYNTYPGAEHGFLLSDGSYTQLDHPGSIFTYLGAINNSGQILGGSSLGFFLLSGGTYTALDLLNFGLPAGLNDAGQIVGTYEYEGAGFVLSDGVYTTLRVPGAEDTEAVSINNDGQVVGFYQDASGYHGFLATPVPEPSTLLLLAIGTLGVIGWAWWKFA
jgi:probable HAF family extracellular repeat protein